MEIEGKVRVYDFIKNYSSAFLPSSDSLDSQDERF